MSKVAQFLDKYSRREFWPMQITFLPLVGQWIWYSIKLRTMVFPLSVNDAPFGWISPYSKAEIGEILPEQYSYRTELYIHQIQNLSPADFFCYIKSKQFTMPFVIKPDYGEQGKGVVIIHEEKDFEGITSEYLEFWNRILIQDYAHEPIEVGIGYAFDPQSHQGKVTGMVVKEFLHVVGDGKHTIGELLQLHPRGHFYLDQLKIVLSQMRDDILTQGENRELLSIGNHVRGSTFYDKSESVSPLLAKKVIEISQSIPGFYFGRYDIRAENWDSLMKGEFKIIELNGADSEPTWVYDPSYSFRKGWSTLLNRQRMIFHIAQFRGINNQTIGQFLDDMYIHRQYISPVMIKFLIIRKSIIGLF